MQDDITPERPAQGIAPEELERLYNLPPFFSKFSGSYYDNPGLWDESFRRARPAVEALMADGLALTDIGRRPPPVILMRRLVRRYRSNRWSRTNK